MTDQTNQADQTAAQAAHLALLQRLQRGDQLEAALSQGSLVAQRAEVAAEAKRKQIEDHLVRTHGGKHLLEEAIRKVAAHTRGDYATTRNSLFDHMIALRVRKTAHVVEHLANNPDTAEQAAQCMREGDVGVLMRNIEGQGSSYGIVGRGRPDYEVTDTPEDRKRAFYEEPYLTDEECKAYDPFPKVR